MPQVSMLGFNLTKNVSGVPGLSASRSSRFIVKPPKAVIGLAACGSARRWARVLGKLGHEVRLTPPASTKPRVNLNKGDAAGAWRGQCAGNALRPLPWEFGATADKDKSASAHLVDGLRAVALDLPADAVAAATASAHQLIERPHNQAKPMPTPASRRKDIAKSLGERGPSGEGSSLRP